MNKDAKENLLSPGLIRFGSECRSELPLVLGEGTFHVSSLPVDAAGEATLQCATVAAFRPGAVSAIVDRCHQGSNAQELPAEGVMVIAVVGGVRQDLVQGDPGRRLHHGGREVRRVIGRTAANLCSEPEVAGRMAEHRELGEGVDPELTSVGTLAAVVEAHVPGLVPGGVDGPFGLVLDQAAAVGGVGNSVEQSIETPFLRRRL